MRLYLLWFLLVSGMSHLAKAQSSTAQQVDYNIRAELMPDLQRLEGKIAMDYYNNSSDTLYEIVFHLWMNAFADKNSDWARQQLLLGERAFHFAHDSLTGGYERLAFKANGKTTSWEPYKPGSRSYSDIAVLHLPEGIPPRSIAVIDIDYILRLPYAFDRPGYKEGLYRLTQWYPKPAVYAAGRWHAMPYLSVGEFYSDYGDYELALTVPLSYSVVSTGAELDERSSIDVSSRKRTYVATAENVRDMACFASEEYIPYRESVSIGDRSVYVNLFVKLENDNWSRAAEFAERALTFFSEKIVPYPYPQITLVESASDEQSGMEYPMLTLLDFAEDEQRMDHLIAHELAHQWFYSYLGNNQREAPWIDEGFASYYDQLYNNAYYNDPHMQSAFKESKLLAKYKRVDLQAVYARHLYRTGWNRSIVSSADATEPFNYLSANYIRMRQGLAYLNAFMGEKRFDSAVQKLFYQYAGRNIDGNIVRQVFESESGQDLGWFFGTFLESSELQDFEMRQKGDSLSLTKTGGVDMPFRLSLFQSDNKRYLDYWVSSNGNEQQQVAIPSRDFSYARVNDRLDIGELRLDNNATQGAGSSFPVPEMISLFERGGRGRFGMMPHIMYNRYDGLMFGLSAYSTLFPQSRGRFLISPSYGLSSGQLAGSGFMEFDILNSADSALRKISLSLAASRFSYFGFELEGQDLQLGYFRIRPAATLHFRRDVYHSGSLYYRYHMIGESYIPDFSAPDDRNSRQFRAHQIGYTRHVVAPLSVRDFSVELQYEDYSDPVRLDNLHYLRISASLDSRIFYSPRDRFFFRVFASGFVFNDRRESASFASIFTRGSIALAGQGFNDQLYEDYYFGRNGSTTGPGSQVMMRDGGFKTAFGAQNTVGMSNDFLVSANLKTDLPVLRLPVRLRPYLDLALSSTKEVQSDELDLVFLYSGGIAVEWGEFFGLYLPLFNADALEPGYSNTGIFNRISFSLDLHKLNLWKWADEPVRILEMY